MKIISIVLFSLMLSGCGMLNKFLPAKPKWPDAVPELTQPCPELKLIEGDKVAITDLLRTVATNYALYYDCSLKNEGWNKWYKEQKQIYDKVGK